MERPTDMASFVYAIKGEMVTLGLEIIKETLENCDQMLRESGRRKLDWVIVKQDVKKLMTSLGMVRFRKTLFKNKQTGKEAYLVDRILGLKSHERMTEDAEAKVLEEVVQTSYRRGGEAASLTDQVSRQTVKNKLHDLAFPAEQAQAAEKKAVDYLYIDADEDHVALQFQKKKGDLEVGENHWKNNCVFAKLVYVYEGIEKEAPKSKRHKLVNPHYFGGVYAGAENRKLWDEVYDYLDAHYDLAKVKKIYLNADGGAWIQAGKQRIAGVTGVLDEFHLRKYLLRLTGHLLDSADEARRQLCAAIKDGKKGAFREVIGKIDGCTKKEAAHKRIAESAAYILNNWEAARIRLSDRKTVKGCSAEGHVSHVLSSRMSSRPMGWSRLGVDKMAHLRAYYWNGGDMLELVRCQREELPMAAGAENEVLSCKDMLVWEKAHQQRLGKYVESISHRIAEDSKLRLAFNQRIWEL